MINQLQKEIQLQFVKYVKKKKIFYQKLTFFTQISNCSTDTILHHPDSELAGQIHLETTKIFHAVLISIYLGNSAGLQLFVDLLSSYLEYITCYKRLVLCALCFVVFHLIDRRFYLSYCYIWYFRFMII